MHQLERRIEKLEAVEQSKDTSNRLVIKICHVQRLPADYQGPKHLVERDRVPCGSLGAVCYEYEEVTGGRPIDVGEDSLRTVLVETFPPLDHPHRLGDARQRIEAAIRNDVSNERQA